MPYNQTQQSNNSLPKVKWDLKLLEKLALKVKKNEEELEKELKKCHH